VRILFRQLSPTQNFLQSRNDKKIPVCYFPINKQVTASHASAELGRLGILPTTISINEMMETIDNARRSVKSWARMQICQIMFEEATRQHLTYGPTKRKVKSFKDITASFKEDSSDEHLRKIWEVAFGTFDRKPGWAKKLADAFMSLSGWVYTVDNVPSNKRTYCVEQQISLIKVELIKAMNTAVSSTHGKTVRISRFKQEITEQTKFDKRIKSLFQAQYIATTVSTMLILSVIVDTHTNIDHTFRNLQKHDDKSTSGKEKKRKTVSSVSDGSKLKSVST